MDGEPLMAIRILNRSFSGGEITPELFGRLELSKVQEALALCLNFITLPHGPVVNRPGTEFVEEVKNSANATRLIPFSYSNTQTFAIQMGAGYFRFHTNAGTLQYSAPAAYNAGTTYNQGDMCASGGVNYYCLSTTTGNAPPNATYWYAMPASMDYEIPSPYAAADLMDIHYTQSADVMTLVHPNYPVMELRRYGATNWRLTTPVFGPQVSMPVGSGAAGTPTAHVYGVQAFFQQTVNGPLGSQATMWTASPVAAAASINNDLTQSGAYNLFSWNGVPYATSYIVYKQSGGVWYRVGQSSGLSFRDDSSVVVSTTTPLTVGNFIPAPTSPTATAYPASGTAASVTAAATVGTGSIIYSYVATAVDENGNESYQSNMAGCSNNLLTAGNYNTITVPYVAGAVRYNVYKLSSGAWGFIGQAAYGTVAAGGSATFIDQNITPDISRTPPLVPSNTMRNQGDYPGAVVYYQQRRVFAGTLNQPQNVWATRSGTEYDMNYTIPTRDDNRLAFKVAARDASAIRHIVPLQDLLLLSASCEWKCSSTTGVLTPSTINVQPQSYIGANNVQPVVVGNAVLYAASRGGHVRQISYNWQINGYQTTDSSIFAPHLFDYNTIVDMAYSRGPIPILWCVSSTGKLLGMTYLPEQQIASWHQHNTGANDAFESVCTISENNEDMLYCIVRRTINGATKRFVERMHTRLYSTVADCYYVDCGATYNGAPATSVSGLSWLNGMTVNILADGAVLPQQVVSGGAITLPVAASQVHVGLPITAQLQTPPASAAIDPSMAQGLAKNLNKVFLRTYRSSGILAGPDFNSLVPYRQRTTENPGSPPNLVSDEVEIVLSNSWGMSGQICIQQSDPLPLDIASMTLEIAVGGGV